MKKYTQAEFDAIERDAYFVIRYSEYNSGNHNFCHKCGRFMVDVGEK